LKTTVTFLHNTTSHAPDCENWQTILVEVFWTSKGCPRIGWNFCSVSFRYYRKIQKNCRYI